MTWNTLESEKLLTTYMLLLVSMSEYSSQQIEVEISSWPVHLFMKSFSLTRNFAQRVSFEPRDPRQTILEEFCLSSPKHLLFLREKKVGGFQILCTVWDKHLLGKPLQSKLSGCEECSALLTLEYWWPLKIRKDQFLQSTSTEIWPILVGINTTTYHLDEQGTAFVLLLGCWNWWKLQQ